MDFSFLVPEMADAAKPSGLPDGAQYQAPKRTWRQNPALRMLGAGGHYPSVVNVSDSSQASRGSDYPLATG